MNFKQLRESLIQFIEDYKLIKDSSYVTSHTKLKDGYNKYYNPNVGKLGTFFGKEINSGIGDRAEGYHYGLDLNYIYEQVRAFCSGIVVSTRPMYKCGRVIFIKDSKGYYHCYAHLSQILVKPNQKIQKGDLIGVSGGSSFNGKEIQENAYNPHLHYSIWKQFANTEKQQAIDPRLYQYP